jgi:hypothetical protein
MKWNEMEWKYFVSWSGIYFHRFNCTFVAVCSWMMVNTDLLLIPTECRTWNKTKWQSSKCNKGWPWAASKMYTRRSSWQVLRFSMQLCSKISRSITWDPLHRDWRCSCDVEWLTLFLECTSNVLCYVVIMKVCGKNGLFVSLFEVGLESGAIDDYFSTRKGSRDNVALTRL